MNEAEDPLDHPQEAPGRRDGLLAELVTQHDSDEGMEGSGTDGVRC